MLVQPFSPHSHLLLISCGYPLPLWTQAPDPHNGWGEASNGNDITANIFLNDVSVCRVSRLLFSFFSLLNLLLVLCLVVSRYVVLLAKHVQFLFLKAFTSLSNGQAPLSGCFPTLSVCFPWLCSRAFMLEHKLLISRVMCFHCKSSPFLRALALLTVATVLVLKMVATCSLVFRDPLASSKLDQTSTLAQMHTLVTSPLAT